MSTFEEFAEFCYEQCFDNVTANFSVCTETNFTDCAMYPKRILNLEYLVPVTLVFLLMFLSGLLGNLSVCAVILKHPSMRTETNVYLFSLAVSDILLLVFGLAPELLYYWQTYPYDLGQFTCRLTKFLSSTATWASALTVVAFSIERYLAICHHSRFGARGHKRVAMAIFGIWVTSVGVALPDLHAFQVVTNPIVIYPGTGKVPLLTQTCRIPMPDSTEDDKYAYHTHLYIYTCVIFFFIPMVVLMLVYINIALFIRRNRKLARNIGINNNCSENTKIFKVLVAVVMTFFICGAPYHIQRLMALRGGSDEDDPEYERTVFVVTGFFYYLSAAINPILYNAISKRYRKAFKDVISRLRRQDDIPLNTVANNSETINRKLCSTTKTYASTNSA